MENAQSYHAKNLQSAFDQPDHGDNGERLENLKRWANGEISKLKSSLVATQLFCRKLKQIE